MELRRQIDAVQEAQSVRAFAQGAIGGSIADKSSLVGYRLLITRGPRNPGSLTRDGLPEQVSSCFKNM